MLALQGYGSSDEEDDKTSGIKENSKESEVRTDDKSTNSIPFSSTGSSLLSLGLKICSAPEVVPTVCLLFEN